MSKKVRVSLTETIHHTFDFDVDELVENDVDPTDADDIMSWAIDMDRIDYSNGEGVGQNTITVSDC